MRFQYDLRDPYDYVRLLALALFATDIELFPDDEVRRRALRRQSYVIVAAILLAAALALAAGRTSRDWHDWIQPLAGILTTYAAIHLVVDNGTFDQRWPIAKALVRIDGALLLLLRALNLPSEVMSPIAIGLGVALGVAICAVNFTTVTPIRQAWLGLTFGTLFLLIAGAPFGAAREAAGSVWASVAVSGVLVPSLLLAPTLRITTQSQPKLPFPSAGYEWWLSLGAMWAAANYYAETGLGFAYFWGITHAPLWPAEIAWSIWAFRRMKPAPRRDDMDGARVDGAKEPDDFTIFEAACRKAFFDNAQMIPCGTRDPLFTLCVLDMQRGIRRVIEMAGSSAQLLGPVATLQKLCILDPLHVVSAVDSARLERYVRRDLPDAAKAILDIEARVAAFVSERRDLSTDLRVRSIVPELHSVLQEFERIQEMRKDLDAQQLPITSTAQMREVYASILRGLEVTTAADIEACRAPQFVEPRPANVPYHVAQIFEQLGSSAARLAGFAATASLAGRHDRLVQARMELERIETPTRLDSWGGPSHTHHVRELLELMRLHWLDVAASSAAALERSRAPGAVLNPYVAGNPVVGDLFIGREDILRQLDLFWGASDNRPSVVIYGSRRMGKTSILRNLERRFPELVVVDVDLQRVGPVRNTGEFLLSLAYAVDTALSPDAGTDAATSAETDFLTHNPYPAFERYLRETEPRRRGRSLLFAIDEFEALEFLIREGRVDSTIVAFLRGLIQRYPWCVMAFAGLHTLEEMVQDYWNPFFGSVRKIEVSFLDESAARHLITRPEPGFPLEYSPEAVRLILQLTNGQPYLIQLIGFTLTSRYNEAVAIAPADTSRGFDRADVERVIGDAEFYRNGDAFFAGVWAQVTAGGVDRTPEILRTLTSGAKGIAEIAHDTGQDEASVTARLSFLVRRAVLRSDKDGYSFAVPLMRDWVRRHKTRPDQEPGTAAAVSPRSRAAF